MGEARETNSKLIFMEVLLQLIMPTDGKSQFGRFIQQTSRKAL
jgi:hypothetical protein